MTDTRACKFQKKEKLMFIPRGRAVPSLKISRNHPRYRTCQHVSPSLTVNGPNCTINIKEHFSCHSSNLVYSISCRRCPALYIGETGRTLRERFGEHLRSIEKKSPGFPVAEHFNGLDHSLSDAEALHR